MDQLLILSSDAGTPDAGNKSWVEVLVTTNGEVVQNGKSKFVLERADLDTCADQIRSSGDKLPLDYDHSYVEGGSTVASGWFTGEATVLAKGDVRPNGSGDLATEDELWAQVEWTPLAAEQIRSKQFRFISAEFLFAQLVQGVKRTVKAFAAATLTNRPYFTRMEAVTLSRITLADVVWDATAGFQHIRDRLAAALNPPAADGTPTWRYCVCDVDVAGGMALVEDEQTDQTYVVPYTVDGGAPTPAPNDQWVEAQEQWVAAAHAASDSYTGREATTREGAHMDPMILKKSLGLADDATDEQVTEALSAAVAKAGKVDELATEIETLKAGGDKTEIEKLREALAAEQTIRLTSERDQLLAQAVTDGKIVPAEKEPLVEAFGENVASLRKVLDARPKNATLARERGTGGDGGDDPDTTAEGKKFETADGDPIDAESLSTHAKAIKILGKARYTEDEYLDALAQAEREQVTA